MKMARTPVNIAAFVFGVVLLLATAHGYTFEQYQSIASQASDAHFNAKTELGYIEILINNANQVGIPRAPYDDKVDDIQSDIDQAKRLMDKAELDASASDGYALAYSEQSSALSLSNQAKRDASAAVASINSALAAQIQFTLTPSQYTTTVYKGKSESVDFVITSQDPRIMACSYSTSEGGTGSIMGRIYGYETGGFSATIYAPSYGAGRKAITVEVSCSVENYATTKKTASIQLQYGEEPAIIAMEAAQGAIDAANDQIKDLELAIGSAVSENPSIDSFLGDARAAVESAKAAVSQAQDSLSKANSDYYGFDKDAALPEANSALSSAQSASRLVADGQGKIAKAKEVFKAEGGQARLTIDSAKSGIKSAQAWLEKANGIIRNATALGMDTKDQVAMVATANGLIENAQGNILDANDELDRSEYAQAKTDAARALNNSYEAEGKAKQAYESLSSVMQACQAAYSGIVAAQSAISEADTIYTRLASVAKNLPQGVDVTSSAQDIEIQRQKLDKAKNGYSAAQNELSAGYCDKSVGSALIARNDAANASNMLGRVAERMKDAVSAALDARVQETQKAIESAKNATSSAGSTYGADAAKVAAAQKQLADAQVKLSSAEATVRLAKSATSLGDFLDKSSQAFGELEAVQTGAQSSLGTANAAKSSILVQIFVAIAAIIGALGIGFMFWTLRKGKKESAPPKGKLGRFIREGKFEDAARLCISKRDYKSAAEYYAKAGKFEKAKEAYKKVRKKPKGA
ncbi:MAG: hypothetical protein QW568_03760 [Candidatus Anstonellaceae archaeon]